jgi:hypothetical protein
MSFVRTKQVQQARLTETNKSIDDMRQENYSYTPSKDLAALRTSQLIDGMTRHSSKQRTNL